MSYTIKVPAIQTRYQGYRFRSRLEARWAVFFDHIGLWWEYEPEGFDVDGTYYLPDFYIRSLGVYAEVKPKQFTEKEYALIAAVGGLVLDGLPDHKFYIASGTVCYACQPEEPDCQGLCYQCYQDKEKRDFWGIDLIRSLDKARLWYTFGADDGNDYFELNQAVQAARSARFEHGERGRKFVGLD